MLYSEALIMAGKLLDKQNLIEKGKKTKMIVAADHTRQAGRGDFVYMIGSKEAGRMFRTKRTPADSAIVGFIDSYNVQLKSDLEE